jgi:acetyl esterase
MPLGPLHPQAEALRRERLVSGLRPLHELSVAEAREAERRDLPSPTREPAVGTMELLAGTVPLRLYVPSADRPLPVLAYFFGGGWVLGSLDAVDHVCRALATATPCAVASVSYRRAPEHPFPAGLEDCYEATNWLAKHASELGLDPGRVAVGGASAGGNLAAAVALLARERGAPQLVFQLLVYPLLDHRAETASMREPIDPAFLGPRDVAWCWSHYLAEPGDGASPFASPLRACDLRGLPPALVLTAEHDPLRDEGTLYAARLRDAGVPVESLRFDGVAHGFFSRPDRYDAAVEAQARAAAILGRAFEPA